MTRIVNWRELDPGYAVGECEVKLLGWQKPRRLVAVRERIHDSNPSLGKKLIDLPEYSFRVFATSLPAPPEEIWRDYKRRADIAKQSRFSAMENRIAELKHDLGADRFCLHDFHATDAVFRSVLLLFNLLSVFRRSSGLPQHKEPATLRSQVFPLRSGMAVARRRTGALVGCWMGWLEAAYRTSKQHLGLGFPISLKLILAAT